MRKKAALFPIVVLLMLAGIVSCGLPPTPSERRESRKVEEPIQIAESSKSRERTAWKDSVWLWPLAGYESGEGILNRPGDKVGKWTNRGTLFLTAPEGTLVLCPEEATVEHMDVYYEYPWSMPITRTEGVRFLDSTYGQLVHELDTIEGINRKYITVYTSLNIGSRKVRITGLMRERGLPEGERLNRGDTLGTLHYAYCAFDEPNLSISIVRFNRTADPMSPFGIPSTFVAPKRLTAEQILLRRVLWVAVPVLIIALVLFVIFRLRDRRRIAYFRRLKEEIMASQASPKSSPEGKDLTSPILQEGTGEATWAEAYRRRIAASVRRFWAMPSAEYLQAAIEDDAYSFSAEESLALVGDIRAAFHDIARDIRCSSEKVNNDEVLYCLLSTLRLPTSVIARCLYVTDSTLRGRKTRLKAKMPEELYNVFFQQ